MANVLSDEKRLRVLAGLVDGNSERAIARMAEVDREAVGRFALLLGQGCTWLHNRIVRDLSCSLVEMDEIWSYVAVKQARVTDQHLPGSGDCWTWVGIDQSSRLTIAWHVGDRDEEHAKAFVANVRCRLVVMPKLITSDGLAAYVQPIWDEFGPAVNYGQAVKNYRYGAQRGPDHKYEPPRDPFVTKRAVYGTPNMGDVGTYHVERQNGTARHFTGRMRRLCYAFSKRIENHRAATALFHVHYNLCHVLRTTRLSPALAAGVTDHVWDLEEFMRAVLDAEPCETPAAGPLKIPMPPTTARQLPNGRGFLRVVPSGAPTPPQTPPAAPLSPPEAPAQPAPPPAPPAPESDPTGQLDLLSWTPPVKEPKQLNLFDE